MMATAMFDSERVANACTDKIQYLDVYIQNRTDYRDRLERDIVRNLTQDRTYKLEKIRNLARKSAGFISLDENECNLLFGSSR